MQNLDIYEKIMSQLEQHKNKRVVFWGASNFLQSFISNPDLKNYNILGIVDSDKNKWNTFLYGYKIFSPEYLYQFKPILIIDTVVNKYISNYIRIKNLITDNYKSDDIKLLPNVINSYYENRSSSTDLTNIGTNFEFHIPNEAEISFYESLGNEYKKYSQMSDNDRLFLTSLVQRIKPKKILELGVSKGGSSFLILNAIKTYGNAKLYSLDYCTEHYNVKGKLTGFMMDEYPHLKQNWDLRTGGLALKFLNDISSSTDENDKFDFCFIDTSHVLPGEVLDFLQVLPYIKQDSYVVFHDTNFQVTYFETFTNNLLMSSISGNKILPYPKPYPYSYNKFSNIGAIHLNKMTFSSLYEVFNLLTIPWTYMPSYEDLNGLIEFIDIHYPEYYSNYFKEVVLLQEERPFKSYSF